MSQFLDKVVLPSNLVQWLYHVPQHYVVGRNFTISCHVTLSNHYIIPVITKQKCKQPHLCTREEAKINTTIFVYLCHGLFNVSRI